MSALDIGPIGPKEANDSKEENGSKETIFIAPIRSKDAILYLLYQQYYNLNTYK